MDLVQQPEVPIAEAPGLVQPPPVALIRNVTPHPAAHPVKFILLQQKADWAVARLHGLFPVACPALHRGRCGVIHWTPFPAAAPSPLALPCAIPPPNAT